jgi:hypothetical protein
VAGFLNGAGCVPNRVGQPARLAAFHAQPPFDCIVHAIDTIWTIFGAEFVDRRRQIGGGVSPDTWRLHRS